MKGVVAGRDFCPNDDGPTPWFADREWDGRILASIVIDIAVRREADDPCLREIRQSADLRHRGCCRAGGCIAAQPGDHDQSQDHDHADDLRRALHLSLIAPCSYAQVSLLLIGEKYRQRCWITAHDHRMRQPASTTASLWRFYYFLLGLVITVALASCAQAGGQLRHLTHLTVSVDHATLYPSFTARRHFYVARCHPGSRLILNGRTARLPRSSAMISLQGYRFRCLPRDFPRWSFRQLRPLAATGRFVVSIPKPRPWIIVFDTSGTPVWWKRTPTNAENAQISANGIVTWERAYGDSYARDPRAAVEEMAIDGRHLRTLHLPNGDLVDGHEFRRLPTGDVLVISYVPQWDQQLGADLGQGAVAAVWPSVFEITPAGQIVWSWSARGQIGLGEIAPNWWAAMVGNPNPSTISRTTYDPLHLNSVEPWSPTPGQPEIIVSSRRTDAIYGVSRATGQIVWKLGGSSTPESLRVIGDPYLDRDQSLFGGQHDVRIDGNILSVYDDRSRTGERPRAAFYRLDLTDKSAYFIRQLTDPEVHSSSWGGSVRDFAGGYLVDWGGTNRVTVFNDQGQIAERFRLSGVSYRANPVPTAISTERLLTTVP